MRRKYLNLLVGLTALFERGASASLNARDEATSCSGESLRTENGLDFNVYCGLDLVSAIELGSNKQSSMADCINTCSEYQPACFGVSYFASNQTCSFKAEGVNKGNLSIVDSDNVSSALVQSSEMRTIKTTCPYENLSNKSIDGFSFQILCDHDMRGYGDFIPWNVTYRQHAGSMGECMELCVQEHPLCVGISWNPDKRESWANCYLKNTTDGDPVVADTTPIVHSAMMTRLPTVDGCTESENIVSNGKTFNATCSQGREGSSNISSVYRPSIQTCVDECAAHSEQNSGACLGVLYDTSFQDGIYNCYLLNATGSASSTPQNFTYAELFTGDTSHSPASPSTSTAASSTPSSSSGNSGSSSSKAWIAGPVIGAVAAVAIAVGAFFWWRWRRGRTLAQEPEKQLIPVEAASRPRPHELPPHYQISEAEGSIMRPRHELPS